jgi:deoxyadenosine/deoxycytidine kinase
MLITIAGNIGSGKSSLTLLLHQRFAWQPYFESVEDNPYLEDFYADMRRWSFHLQVYFLSQRFMTHREITASNRMVVQDRSIYEDAEIFALNLHDMGRMDDRDYRNYQALYRTMTSYLHPPGLMIYLRASVSTLLRQIEQRGREFEKHIEPEYLERLNRLYERWIEGYTLGKLLVIDTDELDFVHDTQKQEDILYSIQEAVRGIR